MHIYIDCRSAALTVGHHLTGQCPVLNALTVLLWKDWEPRLVDAYIHVNHTYRQHHYNWLYQDP